MDFPRRADIPQEILSKLRFVGTLSYPGVPTVSRFECAEWRSENHVLELRDVVLDASDRVAGGILLEERWSFAPQLFIGGAVVWIVRPLATEEK